MGNFSREYEGEKNDRRDGSWTRVDAGVGDGWEDVRELSTPSPNFSLLVVAKQRHDEEAVIDRGRRSNTVSVRYEEEELEGHRTLYVGARMPLVRQSHRHHRRHSQKHREGEREKDSAPMEQGYHCKSHRSPSQRVQFILRSKEDEQHLSHHLFSELDEICVKEGRDGEWKETARWLKFEEDVEDGGERWSKPYVGTLSLHSLSELRSCISNGSVLLDICANSIEEIADTILAQQEQSTEFDEHVRAQVREVLLRKHHHQNEKTTNLLPAVCSFADVSKRQSDLHLLYKPAQTITSCPSPTAAEAKDGVNPESRATDLSKAELHFMKKIPTGAEASNVLVGELDFLHQPIVAFVRLSPAVLLSGMTEVPIPTRFLFVLLGPEGKAHQYHEIGRSMATIMTDEVFRDVAYKAKNGADLVAGIDEFLDQVTVLPPGEWDPSIRIEPPKNVPSQEKRKMPGALDDSASHSTLEKHSGPELQRTGRLFGGLTLDVKRKAPWFWSDFRDGLSLQCLASFLFLYCACMSPVITFGGLLGEATNGQISAMESLLGASMAGVVYCLFAGQPLTILGSTGPVLVFEKILYKFCKEYTLSYLSLRACIGLWTAFLCIVLVATDASCLVCYVTRFTEEAFASLICIIFIYEALEKLSHLRDTYPVHMHSKLDFLTSYYCKCEAPTHPSNETLRFWASNGINVSGIAWENLTVTVRSTVSDFAVFLTIAIMVLLDFVVGIPSPKLQVPHTFKPTRDDRGWFINPIGPNPWWTVLAALVPALLCTILIFMDQQISAVIVNRKEHKLKKGCGYHLDLFVVAVMLGVCSVMGLPWFVAATVLSITHVNSLKVESDCSAPGEQPKFLGIREQRVTGLLIFGLMGCSVFFTSVLKFIPMPVLYGVFLYMGVSSLRGIQLFWMPAKHQPDFIYLRHVPLQKVHLFTVIQLTCLVLLWTIKVSRAAIIFPMMVLALVFVRKAMDFCFSKPLILISSLDIPATDLRIRSVPGWHETLSTCGSHPTVVGVFYGNAIFMYAGPGSGMRGLAMFRLTPESLPSSSWGGKGLREAGVPPGPPGGSQGLRVQILFAFNSIFPVGEEEQVDAAEPSGDQAAAAASLRQMANAFVTVARASVRCVDRSEAEIGKRTSRAQRKSAAEPPRSSTLCHLHRCGWDRAVLHIPKATKSHPRPCCFAGSFCDASDVLGADLLDCSYSVPDRQLVRRVVSQVEFQLSDENLAKDAFLLKHVQKNKMGFVSIKLLPSLKKVKYLTHDW
ncbi:electroneutral sodium bicarbonate exchanger 1-like [Buteo buteo]|uniref:electroneutral sodium bicarbonate exchanger 1-like n=1 Tax=Buteo buteo TaxID=30397 RepID=UPI003EBCC61D